MKFTSLLTDDALTAEIGRRIAAARIEKRMTQERLAEAAGVSKRTVERLEAGAPTQLGNLLRCLRALDKLEGLERLLPETSINPIELLGRATVRTRVRPSKEKASAHRSQAEDAPPATGWVWGDKK